MKNDQREKAGDGRSADESQHAFLHTLNQYRHDWMNDLQVISGYAQLKKLDPILSYIHKVRDKLATDSAISRLGIPSLISDLFVWKTNNQSLQLKVLLDDHADLSGLPVRDQFVHELVMEMIQIFHDHSLISHSEPNLLQLSIEVRDQALILDFEFSGKYNEHELVERLQKTIGERADRVVAVHDFREEKADVQLRIPFTRIAG